MIAKVLTGDEPPIELILGDDHVWTCEEVPELAGALNDLHRDTYGPWAGCPGHWQAHDAARLMNGTIAYLEPPPPEVPGRVY